MSFTRDPKLVRTNGRSVVNIFPSGGAYTDIGFCGTVSALAKSIKEESTFGPLPVGWDLSIEGTGIQVGGAAGGGISGQWSGLIDNPFPTNFQVVGLYDTATLTQPTIIPDLDMKFDGKTGSNMKFVASFVGASASIARAFIVANS